MSAFRARAPNRLNRLALLNTLQRAFHMQSENHVPRFLRFKDLQEPGIAMTRQAARARRCHIANKRTQPRWRRR